MELGLNKSNAAFMTEYFKLQVRQSYLVYTVASPVNSPSVTLGLELRRIKF